MSVSYEAFLPEVMQYCPDVPEIIALNAIKQSCIEFCEKTRYWQIDQDPMTSISGVSKYEIDVPSGTKFVDVIEAWYDRKLLIPKSAEELSKIFRFTDWRSMTGSPAYITRMIPTEIEVIPAPQTQMVDAITMRIAIAPTRASTTVDDDLYESYFEYISYGARARLYGTPKQPYFDKASAMEYERRFRAAITEVRTRVNKGLSRASGTVEYARFV